MSPVACSGGTSTVTPVPVAPATVEVVTVTATTVTIDWSAVSGALSYSVKRSTVSGGPYTTVATGVTDTEYEDTGLDSGETYWYVVSGSNAGGEGPDSDEVEATTISDSPDNYPGLLIWLVADDITSEEGESVFPWPDRASGGFCGPFGFAPTLVEGPPKSAAFGYIGGPLNEGSGLTFSTTYFFPDAAPYTVIAAYAGSDFVLCGTVAFNCQVRVGRAGANVLSAYDNDTEAVSNVLSSPLSSLRMLSWTRSGGVVSFFEGETARGSTFNAGAHTMRFDVMGRNLYVSNVSAGNPSELCVYSGNIGAPAIQSLYLNYFKLKYPSMT